MNHKPHGNVLSAIALTLVLLSGCGGGSATTAVTVSPSSAALDQGKAVNITASVSNDSSNQGVTWTLNGPGKLSNATTTTVTYNAPTVVLAVETAAVTATSIAHTNVSNFAKITVNVPPNGMQVGQSLPNGTTGMAYSQTISVTGGTPPFTWSLSSGTLPPGLTLGSSTGTISGTPTAAGTWTFVLQATDLMGSR